jgi:3-oxoacyl-[acyl-carrier-protein] synthase II
VTLPAVRVAITGIGVIGPHGVGTDLFWDALVTGRSGIRRLRAEALQGLEATAGGEIDDFDPTLFMERKVARRMGRFSQLAVAASDLALRDAAIADLEPERTGVTVHTGAGGVLEGDRELLARAADFSRVGPLYVPQLSANMAAANVAIHLGVTGPVTAGVGACAAGAIGVAEGFHLLRRGDADVVLAGASDAALTAPLVASLANAGALSTASGSPETISRPFDLHRTGFVPSEGAAMFVLEPLERAIARGARVYCEIAGTAIGCDAFHITSPEPTGAGAEAVLRRALAAAGLEPTAVGLIVAHGTGTRLNDSAESAAIARLLGAGLGDVPVTAPKSAVGHTLGAAGAFGVAVGALAVRHGTIPPSLNYDTPDPECPLAIVHGAARLTPVPSAVVNAFGFGGQNAVVVLRAVA